MLHCLILNLAGHVCLTEDDKDNAKTNKGSLLYGELLPRGANKVTIIASASFILLNEIGCTSIVLKGLNEIYAATS